MKLLLVRHGEYIPESVNPEKTLSDKGKADINKIGEQLKTAGYLVDEIFQREGMNPGDDPKPWTDKINNYNGDLMLVGHLPFMESLSGLLLKNDENKVPVRFYEGTVAVLIKTPENNWILEKTFSPN